ncbi:hypothetical protein CRG98_025494 [Punica granatum]|uniref:G-patch domain-containing protein n=1 Tax=Punica granatum TaxID=22663 RepID=A0A2I0JDW8_PUNGR|nr:hypothetical protein CRG98_025494 [Punica granatum]
METPPSFLELSTMEMAEGQKFEDYATNWRSEVAKHFPPICEAQQIQMFHGTLKGAYYSRLMGHKSTFSEMIMAEKQVDLGIKLGKLEGPTKKGEGESSRRIASAATPTGGRRNKEASVNAVNAGHNVPQQYSMSFMPAPSTTPAYAPPPSPYPFQHPAQPVYYSAPPTAFPSAPQQVVHHYAPAPPQTPHRVMIDNGSALNVCPVSTLKQMNVDLNRVRPSKTAVRAFDGSQREVNGEIDLLIDVGPCSFSVTFQVRPSRADRMVGKVLLRHNYVPGTELGAQGQGINCPIEIEEYKNRRGLGFRPSCHEIIEARRGKHLHRLAAFYGKVNRGVPVLPLSHFFPAPPHVIGGTLDGPSSVSDTEPVDMPAICAVTEETLLGVHIRLAQENEEFNNWTSVPCYSAVIADV